MFGQKRCLIMEECDVTTILKVINHYQGFFTKSSKCVGSCERAEDPSKWYIYFYASDKVWGQIAGDLVKFGHIVVKVNPAGTAELYFKRT